MSSDLVDFAVDGLDHAAESVIASGGPLTPFCRTEGVDGRRQQTRCVAETLEEGLEAAREKVRQSTGMQWALVAWDGYLTLDGTRTDAVFVEASDAGNSQSIILAQRYVAGTTVHRLGGVVLAGRGEPLF